jgi:hypothetical protein
MSRRYQSVALAADLPAMHGHLAPWIGGAPPSPWHCWLKLFRECYRRRSRKRLLGNRLPVARGSASVWISCVVVAHVYGTQTLLQPRPALANLLLINHKCIFRGCYRKRSKSTTLAYSGWVNAPTPACTRQKPGNRRYTTTLKACHPRRIRQQRHFPRELSSRTGAHTIRQLPQDSAPEPALLFGQPAYARFHAETGCR